MILPRIMLEIQPELSKQEYSAEKTHKLAATNGVGAMIVAVILQVSLS
jgi:hypothetical protein